MNKSQLVDKIASNSAKTKAETSHFIEAFTTAVIDALKSGEDVLLPGFGVFSIVERAERDGRNPLTGETIRIKSKKVPKFKPGKFLKEAVEEA